MIDAQQIDWQRLTLNLRRHYKPLTVVAREIGCNRCHVAKLAAGTVSSPTFNTGIKLLDLHFDVMGERHAEILIKKTGKAA